MPSDDPNESLMFTHFKHALSQREITEVLGRAFVEARGNDRSARIDSAQLVFQSGNVQLVFYPRVYTTWEMWRYALKTMGIFVIDRLMAFEWTFYVYFEGLDLIGHGVLKDTFERERAVDIRVR